MGPVQVLVIGFDQPTFNGEVVAELARLREAGIVRLVDVLLVSRVDEDTFETLPPPAGLPTDLGRLTAALLRRAERASPDDADENAPGQSRGPAWSLADAVPTGAVAAVALIEHTWATPLRDAIQRAGGAALDETWLAPADLRRLEDLASTSGQREAGEP
jgi:hypothetical protein